MTPGDDLDWAREAWRRVTGEDLAGELRLMYVGGRDTTVVPLAVLRDACRQLHALVERLRFEPPWLFCPEPRWNVADGSEHPALLALDRRLAAGEPVAEDELAERGLASLVHAGEKLEHLLRWRMNALAGGYIDRMRAAGRLDLPEPPWLFSRPVHHHQPHPGERAVLRELEAEAVAVEAAELALGGAEEPPELVERRAALLRRLERHGLLDTDRRDAKLHHLHASACPRLVALYKAALDAAGYLSSSARMRRNPGAEATDVLAGPICIDAFRGLKPPPEVSRFEWIAWGEHLLRTYGPGPDVLASSGDFPYHDQDGLVWVFWRKDAGFPALRHVVWKPT